MKLLRIILFLLSAAAFATAWVWHFKPRWVHEVDRQLMEYYRGDGNDRMIEMQKSIRQGKSSPSDHVEELGRIRESLEHAIVGERLFPVWRMAADIETAWLTQLGRPEDVIEVLEGVEGHDPTNVILQMRYGWALCMLGKLDEARALDLKWAKKLPSHPDYRSFKGLLLLAEGNEAGFASDLVGPMMDSISDLSQGWQVFLFPKGEGQIIKSVPDRLVGPDEDGFFVLDTQFTEGPKELLQVRLDGPQYTRCHVSDVNYQIVDAQGRNLVDKPWASRSVSGATAFGESSFLIDSDPDPRLRQKLDLAGDVAYPISVRIRMKLTPLYSDAVRARLMDSAERERVQSELRKLNSEWLLDRLCPPMPVENAKD